MDIGEEVSVEAAVFQAAHSLDLASRIATESRNADALLDAARSWQKLAEFILNLSEKVEESKASPVPMGFQRPPVAPDNSEEEDESARSDED